MNEAVTKDFSPAAKTERLLGLDLLRIVSMFMVILLHILGQGGILNSVDKGSAKYTAVWFIEIAAYCAVNCYALISGYVGVKSKFKYSNIVFLWIQTVFYTVLITLAFCIIKGGPISEYLGWWVVLPVTKKAYWYFTAYFCIFFFIPFMNYAVNNMPKKQLQATIVAIILLFSGIQTLARSTLVGDAVGDLFVTSDGYSPLWLALLYIVGAYISKYREDFKIRPAICFALYFASVAISLLEKLFATKSVLVSYTSPTVFFAGVILLLAFSQMRCHGMRHVIKIFAPLSFSVYLIHVNPLVWTRFMKGRYAEFAEFPLWKMLMAIFVAAICLYVICSTIDLIRFYLFKLIHLKKGLLALEKKLVKNLWEDDRQKEQND